MKPLNFARGAILIVGVSLYSIGTARADTNADISSALLSYQQALNSGDVTAVMGAFTDTPVVLTPGQATLVGYEAVRASYEKQLRALGFSLVFTIDEIQPMGDDWAFARTHSDGTKVIQASGATLPGGNQELFILRRNAAGQWKIARYAFSVAHPDN